MTDFRDAVFLAVRRLMQSDPNVVVLYNDMGALELDRIKTDFSQKVFNVGICEQNMASVAAGLALTGKRVFTYGIIAHVFARSYEQIRNDICLSSLPVMILGVGSGLSYGPDGPTHHGVQDIAVMRTLPNMNVYNPADCVCASALVGLAAEAMAPAYIRMDKEAVQPVYPDGTDFARGFCIPRKGSDITLVTTGVLVHRALQAAATLAEEGISVRVVDVYRLKPIASEELRAAITGVSAVLTLEENSPIGGLGSIVAEILARGTEHPLLESLNLGDEPFTGSASRGWAEGRFGYGEGAVIDAVRRMVSRSEAGKRRTVAH